MVCLPLVIPLLYTLGSLEFGISSDKNVSSYTFVNLLFAVPLERTWLCIAEAATTAVDLGE